MHKISIMIKVYALQFANYETIVNGVIDSFPKQLMNKHLLVNLATGTTMFLLGLPFACSVSTI